MNLLMIFLFVINAYCAIHFFMDGGAVIWAILNGTAALALLFAFVQKNWVDTK
jgi:hypothetical protein